MRPSTKLATGVFVAALLIAGEGLLNGGAPLPDAAAPVISPLLEPALDPAGMKPLEEVVALWRDRAAADPDDYLSRTQLGAALVRQARETGDLALYGVAGSAFEDALRLNGRHPGALLGLGSVRAADHDFAGQLALATRALELEPGSLAALAAVGDARFELGDYAEAAGAFGRLAAEERTAPVLSRLARLALVEGRTAAAIDLAEDAASQAAALDLPAPVVAQHRFQLGHHRYASGDVAGASAALELALDAQPGHLGSLELLAEVRVAQGRVGDAIDIYEALLAERPAADLHGAVAALYEAQGDLDAAAHHVAAGLALGRSSIDRFPAERRHLAGFFARHDPPLALELAEADLATRHDVYAHDVHAWALFRNGRFPEADAAAHRALAYGTDDVDLLYHAGRIAEAVGDRARASALLTQALELNPRFDVVEADEARDALLRLGEPVPT
ncbi:MAG: tetratricopeptide repeat protein [Acidimicrobiales bacterium]